MAYTLKSTGQATELVACVRVDEDGTTIKEFVNGITDADAAMTVHANVTIGTGTWKSTSYDYFVTTGSSFTPQGVSFSAGTISVTAGSIDPGYGFFMAVNDIDTSSNGLKHLHHIGSLTGLTLQGSPQKMEFKIAAWDASPSTTTISSGTKLSLGYNYTYNTDSEYYYGLESGSLAQDGTQGNDAGRGGGGDFQDIGGIDGQGWCAQEPFIVCLFSSPRTLSEMQALHTDWHGELFEASASTSPSPIFQIYYRHIMAGG